MTTKRSYETSHPWITFLFHTERMSPEHWVRLGEADSKCSHVAKIPLLPKTANRLYRLYLARGVLATTAIEGNTLTEDEVQRYLDGELELPQSRKYLGQEVRNIVDACNQIGPAALAGERDLITQEEICGYNSLVLRDLPGPEGTEPGKPRRHSVGVSRYKAPLPEDLPYLVDRLCDWLNAGFPVPHCGRIACGILRAIVAHLYLAWIHPFADGNGRTARLLEFRILLSSGVSANAAHLLSNHYNQTRTEYYRYLDFSHRSLDGFLAFVLYALTGFVDGLKEQIQTIQQQQLLVHWENYVHGQFQGRDSKTENRRRRLVIDLSHQEKPVPQSKLRHISPRVAEFYAGHTERTLMRDVELLDAQGFVEQTPAGVRARIETMQAFMPPTIEKT